MNGQQTLLRWTVVIALTVVAGTLFSDVWLNIDYRFGADVFLAVAAVVVNAFTVLYASRSQWRAYRIGAIYLVKCVGLSLFLTQAALSTWWDNDYPYRQQIRFAIYATMAIMYVPMLVSLWREQQRDRQGELTEPPHPF